MDHFEIQIGSTDGFRSIGVQPPLSDEHMERLAGTPLPEGMHQVTGGVVKPDRGEPYFELGFSTIGLADADAAALKVAHTIADTIRDETTEVTVHEEVLAIGSGRHLFGGRANRLG